MEKSAIDRRFRFRFRLLTAAAFFAAAFASVSAQNAPDILSLSVKPNSSWFFTGSECGFTLEIPGVQPSQVQASIATLPDGVDLVSLHKDEFISEQSRGTSVRIWLSITKSGFIRLPPLSVRISGRTYSIPFDAVDVYENPALIRPELSAELRSAEGQLLVPDKRGAVEVHAADVLTLSIAVRYAANLTDFSWDLPQNSLFSELRRYPFTRQRNGSGAFSPDWEPVADFEWVPLVSGSFTLPEITVTVVSFGGNRLTLPMPPCTVQVLPVSAAPPADPVSGRESDVPALFSAAFSVQSVSAGTDVKEYLVSDSPSAAKLAELRTSERYAFPLPGFRSERLLFEAACGITSEQKEPSFWTVLFFTAAAVFCAVSAVISGLLRRKSGAVTCAVLCVILAVFSIISAARLHKDFGIFAGGFIRAVPEHSVSGISVFAPCTRVKILSEAGKWIYIQADNNGGWVPSSQVFRIGSRNTAQNNVTDGE